MLDTVKRTISDYMMLETSENVLVALSGGADSTALLLSLRELGYPVRAFHLNHCLRGAESDRDEAFCRRLCEKLGVELTVERVDIAAAAGDSAVEETARRIRYARLEHAAHGAKIAVAHNADDNLETMLFHLVRGTGAKGLTGIPPVRGRIIRPLIAVERSEIEAFLRERGQDFVTDSTNADTVYTRNRLRQEVVPVLRELIRRRRRRQHGFRVSFGRTRLACRVMHRPVYNFVQSGTARGKFSLCGKPHRRFAAERCGCCSKMRICRSKT